MQLFRSVLLIDNHLFSDEDLCKSTGLICNLEYLFIESPVGTSRVVIVTALFFSCPRLWRFPGGVV